ncbi:MAG: hypothetical protein ACOZQL_02010 [Myxococcota bacterium]
MSVDIKMAGLGLRIPDDWSETTNEQPSGTPTLAKHNGIGLLQFTVARYLTGARPDITAEDAINLLSTFLENTGVRAPAEHVRQHIRLGLSTHGLRTAHANLARSSEFVRAWCITDGENSAIATYLTLRPWDPGFRTEFNESCEIVSSIQFPSAYP